MTQWVLPVAKGIKLKTSIYLSKWWGLSFSMLRMSMRKSCKKYKLISNLKLISLKKHCNNLMTCKGKKQWKKESRSLTSRLRTTIRLYCQVKLHLEGIIILDLVLMTSIEWVEISLVFKWLKIELSNH